MRLIFKLITLLFFIPVCLFAQEASLPVPVGVFENSVYSNAALGFRFHTPSGWYVATQLEIAATASGGMDDLKVGNAKAALAIESSRKHERIDFVISKKPMGAVENSAFGFSITRQDNADATNKMVTDGVMSVVLSSPGIDLITDIKSERLGNREFLMFEIRVGGSHSKQRVRIYTTMVEMYTVTFSLTFWDTDTRDLMLAAANTIEFRSTK